MVVLGLAHGGEKQCFEVFLAMKRLNSREMRNFVSLSCLINLRVKVFIKTYGPIFKRLLGVVTTPLWLEKLLATYLLGSRVRIFCTHGYKLYTWNSPRFSSRRVTSKVMVIYGHNTPRRSLYETWPNITLSRAFANISLQPNISHPLFIEFWSITVIHVINIFSFKVRVLLFFLNNIAKKLKLFYHTLLWCWIEIDSQYNNYSYFKNILNFYF